VAVSQHLPVADRRSHRTQKAPVSPGRTTGKSFDCSRRSASVAEGHFETADHLQQGFTVRPAGRPMAGSSLVRRLVRAKDDPAKQRIRARLCDIDDERLFCLGLTSEDIATLRGAASPPAIASQVSPPIASPLGATNAAPEGDPPRRERVSHLLPLTSMRGTSRANNVWASKR
jgi:hypothetical protein